MHKNVNNINADKLFKLSFLQSLTSAISYTLSNITYIGVFFLGAVLVLMGFFKMSVIIAASQLVVFIVFPLESLTNTITSVIASKEIIKDIQPILEYKEKEYSYTAKTSFDNEIIFNDVSFAYPEEDEVENTQVLSNYCLSVKKGEKILIEGESGAGKSTVLNLLSKKFTEYSGEIKIDGVDIQSISDSDYSNLITIVHQSPFIFDDTIKNNITLYSEFDEERIKYVIKHAGLENFIENLPEKIETKIGESASKISGGEKQRIAIARALIKDTPILLLDEATSALDKETAAEIENMLLAQKDKTCIVISHHINSESSRKRFDKSIIVEKA